MNFTCEEFINDPIIYQKFLNSRSNVPADICNKCVKDSTIAVLGEKIMKRFGITERELVEKGCGYYFDQKITITSCRNHYYLIKDIINLCPDKAEKEFYEKYNSLKEKTLQLREKYGLKNNSYFNHLVHEELVKIINDKKSSTFDFSVTIKILENIKQTVEETEKKLKDKNSVEENRKKFSDEFDKAVSIIPNIEYISKHMINDCKQEFLEKNYPILPMAQPIPAIRLPAYRRRRQMRQPAVPVARVQIAPGSPQFTLDVIIKMLTEVTEKLKIINDLKN
jgi:hypothetical protein